MSEPTFRCPDRCAHLACRVEAPASGLATITLWAVVLTKSPGHVKTPYIVRDHTSSPHRFTLFEHEGDARRDAAHFAESFPESAYEVVRLDGNIGRGSDDA